MVAIKYTRAKPEEKSKPVTRMGPHTILAFYIFGIALSVYLFYMTCNFALDNFIRAQESTTTPEPEPLPPGHRYPEQSDYDFEWDGARSSEELEEIKFAVDDFVIESTPLEYGQRFSLVPGKAADFIKGAKQITLKFTMNVTEGYVLQRLLVDIKEIDRRAYGVPFAKYNYKNFMAVNNNTVRTMEVFVPDEYIKIWLENPTAAVHFWFKMDAGFMTNVRAMVLTRPVLVVSRVERLRCSEFACCLTPTYYFFDNKLLYNRIIAPNAIMNNYCVDCMKASVTTEAKMELFNALFFDRIQFSEAPKPVQMGKCRADKWEGHEVIRNVNSSSIRQDNFPYQTAITCNCIEDEAISMDYEFEEHKADYKAIKQLDPRTIDKALQRMNKTRSSSKTVSPLH